MTEEKSPTAGGPSTGGFRRDVQGLRALAVLLVVVDHADIGPVHGGFIGVDVFFVVSGFLITGLLLDRADKDGRVRLVDFYARRARRILPAATLVLAVTVVAGYFLLNGIVALQLFKDAVWATFFAANIRFAQLGVDYNAQEAATSAIQHYWSLAVEEQFYLVWPLVLLVLVALTRALRGGRPAGRAVNRRLVTLTAGGIGLVSFGYALWYVGAEPKAAYFSTPARAWELAAGAVVAAAVGAVPRVPRMLLAVASWAGLTLVVLGALVLDPASAMPGLPALLPVVGTVLLLVGGAVHDPLRWGPQRLLSVGPACWIGDRSYSLYLWHWPALILVAAAWQRPSGWSGLAVVLGALVLSDLSYRYVENPFRRASVWKVPWRGVALYPASVALMGVVVLLSHTALTHAFEEERPAVTVAEYQQDADLSEDPYVALVQASVLAARDNQPVPNPLEPAALGLAEFVAADLEGCEYFGLPDPMPLCRRGDPDADRVIVAVGDSHVRHWIPALEAVAKRRGYAAYYFPLQGCTPALVQPWTPIRDEPDEDCVFFHEWTQRQIERLKPDVVLMSTDTQQAYVSDDGEKVTDQDEIAAMIREGMVERYRAVTPFARRVIVLGDVPRLQFDPAVISERDVTLADGLSDPQPRAQKMRRAVKASVSDFGALPTEPGAGVVDYVETSQWFCAYGQCPVVIGDFITHRDRGHMTLEYSAHLARPLDRALRLE